MRSTAVLDRKEPEIQGSGEASPTYDGFLRRAGAFLLREFRELLPPTIFFIVGFNLIVLTTNLLLSDYGARFASFMLATVSALIVAKALLIANAMPAIRRYDRAPLIRPVLFKTAFYWAAVFIVHLLEEWIRYRLGADYVFGGFVPHQIAIFSWAHFIAVQLWILVLFLIYVTAHEFNHLFGEGELWHLFVWQPAIGTSARSAAAHPRADPAQPSRRYSFARRIPRPLQRRPQRAGRYSGPARRRTAAPRFVNMRALFETGPKKLSLQRQTRRDDQQKQRRLRPWAAKTGSIVRIFRSPVPSGPG